ncbi:hypothetical protein PR202_gb11666 [Eleusine coracana subsp. coracana]|uniref:Uncharacterized protein n=1 Tax=Eleusine coracana subsp. coracana TaxID=191504 RepID=A0AAV5ENW3_ELECO|nr:hypothetical protein PR202_gb11666 [Eleusine coracana subsp. coracana]
MPLSRRNTATAAVTLPRPPSGVASLRHAAFSSHLVALLRESRLRLGPLLPLEPAVAHVDSALRPPCPRRAAVPCACVPAPWHWPGHLGQFGLGPSKPQEWLRDATRLGRHLALENPPRCAVACLHQKVSAQ